MQDLHSYHLPCRCHTEASGGLHLNAHWIGADLARVLIVQDRESLPVTCSSRVVTVKPFCPAH